MRIYDLNIYRPGLTPTLIGNVEIGESTVFEKEFMGMDRIVARFSRDSILPIGINDYVEYLGDQYSIKDVPAVTHNGNGYNYELTFYSPLFAWYDTLIMHLGSSDFSYTGTPFEFVSLLLGCIQSFDNEWQLGDISLIDEPLTLTFSNQSCYVSLFQVVEAFGLEFSRSGKTINIVESIGIALPLSVQYGRGMGLYELIRKNVDGLFATEWYGFGGTQNLPIGYGSPRLSLSSPIQRNTSLYGRKQGAVTFDYIFPRYEGSVTSTANEKEITDSGIDFPIVPMADGSAKIVFKTGPLGGNEFTITGWDEGTGKVTFGVNREESGYELPNETVKAEIGDKYTVVGTIMSSEYVSAAEVELLTVVEDHADGNSHPKAAYELLLDEKFVRDMGLEGEVYPGDSLRVRDGELGLDAVLKIQNVSWPLVNPGAITASIAETLLYTYQERISKDTRTAIKEASIAQKGAIFARRLADEIANAVILSQFNRTYIGDRAVLTGVFVAGNPEDGAVAGISGVGSAPSDVRFWAGSSYENRESAPFRALQNGNIHSTAGYIGGFKILPSSLESANEYGGSGKFVLYPDDGFVAFIDNTKGIWSGIGVNTLSASFGVRAVGRFENKEVNTLGTNYGVLAVAEGAFNNIAIYAKGSVAVDGALSATNYYRFTPSVSGNTLSARTSNNAMVLTDDPSFDTVYLPTENDISASFGLGSTSDFLIQYSVMVHFNAIPFILTAPYDMRDWNGNVITSINLEKGDASEWVIFRESGVVTAQMKNLNRTYT